MLYKRSGDVVLLADILVIVGSLGYREGRGLTPVDSPVTLLTRLSIVVVTVVRELVTADTEAPSSARQNTQQLER